MRFFRSEESLRAWLPEGEGPGAVLSLPRVWALSRQWYHNRLSADYRGRSLAEIQAIFRSVGLAGAFWEMD